MEQAEHKGFTNPDEIREFPLGRMELVNMGRTAVGRATFEPGWSWSESVKPIAQTESCEAPHFQYQLSGTMHVVMDDGTEFDVRAGEVSLLPPGHNAWVVGDEPVVVVDFQGMREYALKAKRPHRRLKKSA